MNGRMEARGHGQERRLPFLVDVTVRVPRELEDGEREAAARDVLPGWFQRHDPSEHGISHVTGLLFYWRL